jgi:hypothetical protein
MGREAGPKPRLTPLIKHWAILLCVGLLLAQACATTGAPTAGAETPVVWTPAVATAVPTAVAAPSQVTAGGTAAPGADGHAYNVGNPALQEVYVAPEGDDGRSGATPAEALRTLTEAWNRLPDDMTATGYRINLLPGVYPCGDDELNACLNRFSDRWGTFEHPIIIRGLNGPGTVTLRGGMDVANVRYLYLMDLTLAGGGTLPTNISGNNLLHLADVKYVLVRRVAVDGPDCANDTCTNLQEVFKVNQAQYLYVEESEIGGAWHSSVDFFAVQYGHFLNNDVHTAGQWCMYIKGGTAYLDINGNRFHDCQLGFQAGQAANFAMMVSPWLTYEAYGVRFTNNVLDHIPGVGLSVAGGYNILLAYNTLYRVGYSQEPGYPLLSLVRGERNCTPTDEQPDAERLCQAQAAAGGWGPTFDTQATNPDDLAVIPNRHVYVFNNLFYNPQPEQTAYAHFLVQGAYTPGVGFANLPGVVRTDDDLVIAGNLIWNGPVGFSLGVEEATAGCQADHPTCNVGQLTSSNTINTLEPQLANPEGLDFRPLGGGAVLTAVTYPIPDFSWADAPSQPAAPEGRMDNQVTVDRAGQPRASGGPPGAYGGNATAP